MIIDSETNIVYFSEILRTNQEFVDTCKRITGILDKHHINFAFLKATKDIWARDYMPVQKAAGEFIQFRYEPSYLKEELEKQSKPKEVCEANKIHFKCSNINLDGGNVIKWHDKVMITDRIKSENPEYKDLLSLTKEIEKLLNAEVIIIPQIKSDFTGHADGLVRFYNDKTIIGNDRKLEYKYWVKGMNKVLIDYKFDYVDMPLFEYKHKGYPDSAVGCYMNWLEIGSLIIFPVFEVEGNKDKEAVELIESLYPKKTIEPININEVAKYGGLMNCITWNIKV